MQESWIRVARLADIPDRQSRLVTAGGESIALWRVGDNVHAVNNVCPHQHFSKLHEGTLDEDGEHLTCPMHGWTFCLKDGLATSGSGRARVYRVRIATGDVLVNMTEVDAEDRHTG
jgi:nitrite reductase/ring-hydroxylating ferredoxin subunit